jgi:general secretion pathway protein D
MTHSYSSKSKGFLLKPLVLLACSGFALPVLAQMPGAQSAAEREIQRRSSVADSYAPDMIARGQAAMNSMDYESAFSFYRAAVDALPSGGPAVSGVRSTALDGFSQAAVSLARQRISEGRFEDAEDIIDLVIADYNPTYGPALTLEKQLNDPGYFNRTTSPQFLAKIEEVKQLINEADGFYQSGRYDLAFRRYEQVLNLDRYNIAARRGMEKVNNARDNYATNARNQTRAAMISEVDRGWELPVPRYDLGVSAIIEQPTIDITGTQRVADKLNNIIIPQIEFIDVTIREAIDFVKQQAARLDTSEPDPAQRGINIVLLLDPAAQEAAALSRITLNLRNAPLGTILDIIAESAGLKTKIEPYAVAIVPLDAATDVLITKEYTVPPSFVNRGPDSGGAADPTAALTTRAGAREFLESMGVTFPEGASAQFIPSNSKLIVRNTPNNLTLIDTLVEIALASPDTQVEIQSKFLEVTQNNLQELGVDWLVGQFALPFGTGVYGSGGTSGNQGALPADAFPQGAGSPYLPYGANSVSQGNINSGQITAGNRSGASALSVNALDALLFGTPAGVAPGVLSVAGIFTNPQFQVVLRALDQAKGVDIMSAPTITTMNGMPASIEVVQEFIYPESYDPPQVPGTVTVGSIQPVTPATPQNFAMENVGVTLNVNPRVEGFTITLELQPIITNFDGFINYGSPINTVAPILSPIGGPLLTLGTRSVEITENRIEQPVFSYREVQTEVTIFDGQTVALGGLIREDVQSTNDKVPIIGDIPLLGRAFRTETSARIKRNLVIFVTANLLDPSGQPVNQLGQDDDFLMDTGQNLIFDEIIPGDVSSIESQF